MNSLPDYPTFGQRLQHARKSCGLTLKGLAKATGININILSRYERNKQQPSDPVRYTILAEALDVPSDWLVEPTVTDVTRTGAFGRQAEEQRGGSE